MKNGATNPLSNSICVSSALLTNQSTSQTKNIPKKSTNISSSIEIGTTKYGSITKKSQPKVTAFNASTAAGSNDSTTTAASKQGLNLTVNGRVNGKAVSTTATATTNSITNPKQTMNGYKSVNGTTLNQYNKASSGSGGVGAGGTNINHNNNITNNNNNSNQNASATINIVKNNNETKSKLSSSDSFKRRLGTFPLSPNFHPEFLKCEYDLARSQVINSRSRSACSGEKNNNYNNNHNQISHNSNSNNNNNNSISSSNCNKSDLHHQHNKTNGFASQSLTSSPVAKDTNRNKVTIFGVNTASASVSNTNGTANTINLAVGSASSPSPSPSSTSSIPSISTADHNHLENQSNETMMNANCIQHATVDHLDDIKFIDSDDSEHRRHSPANAAISTASAARNVATLKEFFNDGLAGGKALKTTTSTLPAASSASKKLLLNDLYGANKYNTITNGSCGYQAANGHYHHMSNGLARKAVPEEMLSSTSSSTSTLSAMTESSTSSSLLAARNLATAPKENGHTTIKVANHLDGGDPVSVSACKKQKHISLVVAGDPIRLRLLDFRFHLPNDFDDVFPPILLTQFLPSNYHQQQTTSFALISTCDISF